MRQLKFIVLAAWLLSQCCAHAAVMCENENLAVSATTPTDNFEIHGNGTAIDMTTGNQIDEVQWALIEAGFRMLIRFAAHKAKYQKCRCDTSNDHFVETWHQNALAAS